MSNIARSLKEREQAFEAHYQMGAEQNFRIRARRDRLFGEWVAEKLGLEGDAAIDYAIHLAKLDMEEAGDANVIFKIRADLKKADVVLDDLLIIERLGLCQIMAMEDLRNEDANGVSWRS